MTTDTTLAPITMDRGLIPQLLSLASLSFILIQIIQSAIEPTIPPKLTPKTNTHIITPAERRSRTVTQNETPIQSYKAQNVL